MSPDTAAKLDGEALAELTAERERHARNMAALSHTDTAGLAAELDRYVVAINGIMAAFMARATH